MDEQTLRAEQEAVNLERLAEVGTCPPCPFCGVPRVQRSTYIRCLKDGVNWLDEEMHLPNYLNRNPSACRNDARMAAQVSKPAERTGMDAKERSRDEAHPS